MKRFAFIALALLAACGAEDRFLAAPQIGAVDRVFVSDMVAGPSGSDHFRSRAVVDPG